MGIPLPVVSVWLARRGSTGALLVCAGALSCVAYSYYFFVIGGSFVDFSGLGARISFDDA